MWLRMEKRWRMLKLVPNVWKLEMEGNKKKGCKFESFIMTLSENKKHLFVGDEKISENGMWWEGVYMYNFSTNKMLVDHSISFKGKWLFFFWLLSIYLCRSFVIVLWFHWINATCSSIMLTFHKRFKKKMVNSTLWLILNILFDLKLFQTQCKSVHCRDGMEITYRQNHINMTFFNLLQLNDTTVHGHQNFKELGLYLIGVLKDFKSFFFI